MVDLLNLEQGHVEIHVHKGAVTDVPVMDKSLKFRKEQSNG